jgi:hypothetical protein
VGYKTLPVEWVGYKTLPFYKTSMKTLFFFQSVMKATFTLRDYLMYLDKGKIILSMYDIHDISRLL